MERNSELEEKLKECKKNSLLRDKKFVERHPEEIKVGDILQLMPGTTIPADGIVIKGKELSVDESFCRIGIKEDVNPDENVNVVYASKSLFQESLHINKIFKNKIKINDKQAIEGVISEFKSKIKTDQECTPELISKLHEIAVGHRLSNNMDDTIPDSPIVLSGTNVMQGIGQMLVLAVGDKRY
jgi:magnesium-transporting ATPase (P-type)